MANEEHVAKLQRGVLAWNTWRKASEKKAGGKPFCPDLSGEDLNDVNLEKIDFSNTDLSDADLSGANLAGSNFKGANLSDADLLGAKLAGSNFKGANLSGASLSMADLKGANFSKANLSYADLTEAGLVNANLNNADLSGIELMSADLTDAMMSSVNLKGGSLETANLTDAFLHAADVRGATLSEANFTRAYVGSIIWDRKLMRGRCRGVRGIDSCYGNSLFKRDVEDQDFLDTLEASYSKSAWKKLLFSAWGLIDFGRSLSRIAICGLILTVLYGGVFSGWPELLDYTGIKASWFSPFYFSIVTFTTLGFGDVKPQGLLGEMLTCSEVILGYINLGLLLAVLANKVARRS